MRATATATSFMVQLSFVTSAALEHDGSSMDDVVPDGALQRQRVIGGDADSGIHIAFTPSADEILKAVSVAFEVRLVCCDVPLDLISKEWEWECVHVQPQADLLCMCASSPNVLLETLLETLHGSGCDADLNIHALLGINLDHDLNLICVVLIHEVLR